MKKLKTVKRVLVVVAGALAAVRADICSAELAPGRFTHDMPAETNMRPTNPAYAELASVFRDPFGKVPTGCYWYWINGNISREGIREDLRAMKRAGIDRAYIGDIGSKGGPVKTFSPEWEKALATAFETANELGVELGLFNSPGWSQSGGPWVKPEQAMRRLVASSAVVTGPAKGVKLPTPTFESVPADEFQDVVAVAYPAPKGLTDRLEAKDAGDSLLLRAGKPLVVTLASETPFTAQGVELAFCDGALAGEVSVEAEGGDGWRTVCEMPFSRVKHITNVGFAPHAPILGSFVATTSRRFRVTIRPHGDGSARFASVAVCGAPLIARAYEKTFAKMFEAPLPQWRDYLWPAEPATAAGTALDPAKAVVLRGKVARDGALDWAVPAGRWVVYRFAAAGTGTRNSPANPEATGYETDKMSRAHIASHFDAYLGKILARMPASLRKAVRYAVLDSYEMGGQNFTDDFESRFRASFGYDPTPYFPSVFGMPTGSRADADRFLWDLRRFVADEIAYSYVGGLRAASNRHGLKTWLECYGHWGFPGEFLQYGGQSDGIGGEFWSEGTLGDLENRAASSCAHIYGKQVVWSESNTCAGRPFARTPMDLKSRTDLFFADGVNGTILHVYIHQHDERLPGNVAWFGNEFNRKNTWFRHFDLFSGYLKRTGYLLQQGLNVADAAYFIGEDVPKMTGLTEPGLPPGRQFDYINAEVLRETTGVDAAGRLVLPHGTTYEVLVLPKLETMRPELLAQIERLVHAGAFVLGPKPQRSPSLTGQPQADARVKEIAARLWGEVDGRKVTSARRGKGVIAWGLTMDEAFRMRGCEPDLSHDGRFPLVHAHRTLPNAEIYFVANADGRPVSSYDVSFRVAGRVPELWDAATGEIREAPAWRFEKGRTVVNLSLAARGSTLVVFAKETDRRTGATPRTVLRPAVDIPGPWTLAFEADAIHRGPAEPVKADTLFDLSTVTNPALAFYSGTIVYRTTFRLDRLAPRLVLDLGDVAVTAKVKVNGTPVGGVCFAPYRLDVTKAVRTGENTLEVEVCNLWINRLVGDEGLADRPTWSSRPCVDRDTPLPRSGLIGPVRLLSEDAAVRWRGFNIDGKAIKGMFSGTWDERDLALMRDWGFNFARVMIDHRYFCRPGTFEPDPALFPPIDEMIGWGRKHDIHIQVCFSIPPGVDYAVSRSKKAILEDPALVRANVACWTFFARRYRDVSPDALSFNLFNEPSADCDAAAYAGFIAACEQAIHAESPSRLVVADGLQMARTPPRGTLPASVGLGLHVYDPMEITHYEAPWCKRDGAWPAPQWPPVPVTSPLYGSRKKGLDEPIAIARVPACRLTVVPGRVNRLAELVVKADGREIGRARLFPQEGDAGYTNLVARSNGEWAGVPVAPFAVDVPTCARLEIGLGQGDWMEVNALVFAADGRTARVVPSYRWRMPWMPARTPVRFAGWDAPQPLVKPDGTAYTGADFLRDNVFAPWEDALADGRFVMVGETGVFNRTPHDVSLAYLESLLKELKARNIGWAFWNFRGPFGPLDSNRADVDYEEFQGHRLDRKMLELLQRY